MPLKQASNDGLRVRQLVNARKIMGTLFYRWMTKFEVGVRRVELRSPLSASDSRAAGTALPYHSYNFSLSKNKLFLGYIKKAKGRVSQPRF
jgi:hypothetical protein